MCKYVLGVIGVAIRARHSLETLFYQMDSVRVKSVSQYNLASELHEGWTTSDSIRYAYKLGANYCEDWQSIVDDPEINIVSIMLPPKIAPLVIKRCIDSGKHIILDKPAFLDSVAAKELLKIAAKKQIHIFFQYSMRFMPAITSIINEIKGGAIGNPLVANIDILMMNGPLQGFKASSAYREAYNGGELMNFGCYGVDIALMIMGQPKWILKQHGTYFYDDYKQCEIEDFGKLIIGFSDRRIAKITAGRLPYKAEKPIIQIHVTGENGFVANIKTQPEIHVVGDNAKIINLGQQPLEYMAIKYLKDLDDEAFVEYPREYEHQYWITSVLQNMTKCKNNGHKMILEGDYE